ncbi:hypothetical protein [Cohnella pontilimi]|uniref:hypothetical protein n=1 Tax=Cohnella pontilimi TaxID=2564100 RepID=UPI00145C5D9C|nr:hypothetical protein [Cohnella pontilimi]
MGKAKKGSKSKHSNKPSWLLPVDQALKSFQRVKDKDLGEGLINLTVALMMKRHYKGK